jgi:replicative DNA helicase
MASGRKVKATANHPFRMLTGWKPLDELKVGDRIAVPRVYPRAEAETTWPDEKIILLAHMIGDGCYAPRSPVHYTSASEANLQVVAQAAGKSFGIHGKLVKQENWHHLYLTAGANKWHPNPLVAWLRELGIDCQRSYNKVIPTPVFTLPPEQIALFLRHLWATDGSNYLRKTTHGQGGTIYYSTSSETLAHQVQQLLNYLGIQSRIGTVEKKGYRKNYHVHVSGRDNQLRFALSVGAFGERVQPLSKLVEHLTPLKSNPNRDTYPVEVWSLVKARMKELGFSQREMARLRGTSYGGDAHFDFAPTRKVLTEYAELLDAPSLRALVDADIYWDEVISIEPCGEEDVYDMTVPGAHSFVANGIIVHNSLEQDADIVMFIHRPDAMEKDSPKANLAEIIVAKHRNGPTHPGIELIFLNNLARFENAAPPPPGRH